VKLKQLCSKWDEFDTIIEELDNWMKNVEAVVKNQNLKSTAEAKNAHLKQLQEIAKDIERRGSAINELMDEGRESNEGQGAEAFGSHSRSHQRSFRCHYLATGLQCQTG